MSIYSRKFQISYPVAILIIGVILLAVFLFITMKMTAKTLMADEGPVFLFAVGLVPGLAVALIQFLLSWVEFKEVDKFKKMRIKGILNSRDEEAYYRELIMSAQTKIDVLGVTASRFVSDFADNSVGAKPEKQVLIEALRRGVHVRILLPERHHLSQIDSNEKFPVAYRKFTELSQTFNTLLEVKYFNHIPIASLVRIDDEALVGPVFHNLDSRNTPTIHTTAGSVMSQSYLNYFDSDWQSAKPIEQITI